MVCDIDPELELAGIELRQVSLPGTDETTCCVFVQEVGSFSPACDLWSRNQERTFKSISINLSLSFSLTHSLTHHTLAWFLPLD